MNDLQKDLQDACNALYARPGQLSAADKPLMTAKLEERMAKLGGWTLDVVDIDFDAADNFVHVDVQNGLKKASISLRWPNVEIV